MYIHFLIPLLILNISNLVTASSWSFFNLFSKPNSSANGISIEKTNTNKNNNNNRLNTSQDSLSQLLSITNILENDQQQNQQKLQFNSIQKLINSLFDEPLTKSIWESHSDSFASLENSNINCMKRVIEMSPPKCFNAPWLFPSSSSSSSSTTSSSYPSNDDSKSFHQLLSNTEKRYFSIAFSICQWQTSLLPIPHACQIYNPLSSSFIPPSSESASTTNPNIHQCLKKIQASPQLWTTYNGYFQTADLLCHPLISSSSSTNTGNTHSSPQESLAKTYFYMHHQSSIIKTFTEMIKKQHSAFASLLQTSSTIQHDLQTMAQHLVSELNKLVQNTDTVFAEPIVHHLEAVLSNTVQEMVADVGKLVKHEVAEAVQAGVGDMLTEIQDSVAGSLQAQRELTERAIEVGSVLEELTVAGDRVGRELQQSVGEVLERVDGLGEEIVRQVSFSNLWNVLSSNNNGGTNRWWTILGVLIFWDLKLSFCIGLTGSLLFFMFGRRLLFLSIRRFGYLVLVLILGVQLFLLTTTTNNNSDEFLNTGDDVDGTGSIHSFWFNSCSNKNSNKQIQWSSEEIPFKLYPDEPTFDPEDVDPLTINFTSEKIFQEKNSQLPKYNSSKVQLHRDLKSLWIFPVFLMIIAGYYYIIIHQSNNDNTQYPNDNGHHLSQQELTEIFNQPSFFDCPDWNLAGPIPSRTRSKNKFI